MNRRDFVRLTGSGVTAGTLAESLVSAQVASQPHPAVTDRGRPAAPKALMKAGTQHGDSDAILRVLAGFGVNHICSRLPSAKMDEAWSVESLTRLRERVESFGITLDMVPLPLSSSEISRSENPAILLARDPDRNRQIDDICQMIRNCARAGIPSVKYNLTLIGIPRTAPTPGRGGARYSTFVYAGAKQDPPLTAAGPVNADIYWERITYFLTRVVPVADEYKVRLACHPQDPGMPPRQGLAGRRDSARIGRRPEALRLDRGEPVPRPELLPGHGLGDAREAGRADLRRHPLFRLAPQDLQRPFPEHRRRLPELPRDVHRRRRRGHVEGDARLQGSRLRRHDDARPRAAIEGDTTSSRGSRSRSATSRR